MRSSGELNPRAPGSALQTVKVYAPCEKVLGRVAWIVGYAARVPERIV